MPPDNGTRLALVIGNGNYNKNANKLKLGALDNPLNDAYDMASALKGLGYQVILRTNVNKTAFNRAVRDFRQRLSQGGGVGLFYFSGHGFQYENINYLMPLQADIRQDIDIKEEALKADAVLQQMQVAHSGVNIMILDACRDSIPDEFFKDRKNKGAFKGLGAGLTQMNALRGSLIAYGTAPNTTAWGGLPGERNSVYTKYLLKALKTKAHLNYAELFIEVRKQVSAETQNEEVQHMPWEANSLTRKFCFGTCQDEDWDRERAAELKQQPDKLARERAELEQQRIEQEKRARQRANKSYRYTDNGDGTVTDNRTGLIWMKNANCFGRQNWKTAMQSAANLAHGQCGLRDGSRRGMWRLPTIKEWKAMMDKKYSWPALSNAAGTGKWEEGDAFLDVQSGFYSSWYWSSTTTKNLSNAGLVHFFVGFVEGFVKSYAGYVWAVRGGH
jgi:uncharacterized caspase-like protein